MYMAAPYVLSWTGTCQARYAINSATPAGAYANSPIIITGQTAGTTMSVEFGNGAASGTLGHIQLELGTVATPFEFRQYPCELQLCQRYYEIHGSDGTSSWPQIRGYGAISEVLLNSMFFAVPKRVPPTMTKYGTWTVDNCGQPGANNPTTMGYALYMIVTALGGATASATAATCFIEAKCQL